MSDSDDNPHPTHSYNLRPRPRYLSTYPTIQTIPQPLTPTYCDFPEQSTTAATPKSLARQFNDCHNSYANLCLCPTCIRITTRPERHQPSPLIIDDPEFLTVQPVIPTTLVCPEYSIYTPVTSQLPVDSIESTVSSSLPLTTSDTFLPEQRLSTLSTSFNQRFQKYTLAIIHFGITIVSGIFALIYSILRYFFGDVHPIFFLENLQDFLLPPFIPRYNISSLELRYAETYSTAGILQRLYGDYSRAYSTQLFCVFIIHVYITLHNSVVSGSYFFNFGYHNIAYLPTHFIVSYAYGMLFLAYLPFVHRYLTKAILTEGIYHSHRYFQTFKSFIQQYIPQFTFKSTRTFIIAPTTRRTASATSPYEQHNQIEHSVPPSISPITANPTVQQSLLRHDRQFNVLQDDMRRMENTMNNLQETLYDFVVNFQNTQNRHSRNLQHQTNDENYDVPQPTASTSMNQHILPEVIMQSQFAPNASSAIPTARPSYDPNSFPNNFSNVNTSSSRRIAAFDPRNVSNPERNVILTQDDVSQFGSLSNESINEHDTKRFISRLERHLSHDPSDQDLLKEAHAFRQLYMNVHWRRMATWLQIYARPDEDDVYPRIQYWRRKYEENREKCFVPPREQPSIQTSLQRLVELTSMQGRPSVSTNTDHPFRGRQYSHTNFRRNDDNRRNFESQSNNFNQRRFTEHRDDRGNNNNNHASFHDRRIQNKRESDNTAQSNNDASQLRTSTNTSTNTSSTPRFPQRYLNNSSNNTNNARINAIENNSNNELNDTKLDF